MSLCVDYCTYKAAKYAVEHWHYSGSISTGKRTIFGVWEHNRFIGSIVYGQGANRHLARNVGLVMTACCELTRVALREHDYPVTQMIAQTIKRIKQDQPGLRCIISYADLEQGHEGKIYQAGNWIYLGLVQQGRDSTPKYRIHGKVVHGRTLYNRGHKQQISWLKKHIDPNAEYVWSTGKHKYAYPLDRAMRRQLEKRRKSYPCEVEINGDLSNDQLEGAGSIPALRSTETP